MMDHHVQLFKEEAHERLAELETSLLALEDNPTDHETVSRVFRAMHTIKGSGAMFGFDEIARFTHEVETVFDLVRNGAIAVTGELINLALQSRDHIRNMLDASDGAPPVDAAVTEALIAGFRMFLAKDHTPAGESRSLPPPALVRPEEGSATYRIRFSPAPGIIANGTNPLTLIRELSELGEYRVTARTCEIPCLDEITPEQCHLSWDITLTTDRGLNAVQDVFIFVMDDGDIAIEEIGCGGISTETGDPAREEVNCALLQRSPDEPGRAAAPGGVSTGAAGQDQAQENRQGRQPQDAAGNSIRVPAGKLDTLVNLVGELVTVQARLTQTALLRDDDELMAIAEDVERLSSELRDNALNIRMLPIGMTFSKFQRLVRDLSCELGKEIEMTTAGAETELDKTVIERLGDPLVHIIRNSIDHGIEFPDEREAAGKPGKGTIHLSAVHAGENVVISIADNGAGLDSEAIRVRGIERGLIQHTAELSEKEIHALIFAPGFSTAKRITSVSGRGVGMDVVKRSIEALRGSIEIASRRGVGTTITIRIPLTLAIIESLLVKVDGDCFVIPLSVVNECIELTPADIDRSHGRHFANVRGRLVPYIPLRERFDRSGDPPEIQQIVVTEVNGMMVGFVVDHVIGEHQTVIKSLGKAYRSAEGVSGATILGDGSVALILDTQHLVREVASTPQ
ncbi:chemotaxis protein CheA [Geobacter sp. SVR]|uniref:chemotaxis protein CheA n=1 Tax=Geobacter sp. SVR TaxID=2495594 RepID=UPI00143F03E9|nr:chemotaxis protein CheA [Geobacter sp. SVR]BCS54838.1 chemotaxis protein CheA [Geobacter sp. SVR]GCF86354.1 chemotaxis protein CheA [Geobacter sp. SVR]